MTTPSTVIRSIQAEKVEPHSPADVRQWLSDMSDEHLACRLWMHAWIPPYGYHDGSVNGRAVKVMILVCGRCGSEKADRIKVTRKTVTRDSAPATAYAEGYLAPPGMRVTKDQLRAEWMRRMNARRRQ